MVHIEKHPDDQRAFRLTTQLHVPLLREEVFAFFADAMNLQQITPPWLHFSVLTPPPIEMRAGTLIDYRLRLHGIPIRWRTRITAWDPPYRFVDEQVRGPYRFWRHEHTFVPEGDGCLVGDRVDYAVPGGAWVHWLLVRGDVRKIFEYRQRILRQRFSAPMGLAMHSG